MLSCYCEHVRHVKLLFRTYEIVYVYNYERTCQAIIDGHVNLLCSYLKKDMSNYY